MPGDGFQISPAAVAAHAGAVDQVADGMELGRAAAAQVQLGGEAYGKLCAFLPGLIDRLADPTVDALTECAAALRETAVDLRSAATSTEATDQAGSRRVAGAGRRIELPL
ncbi:type VII secretion target [Actinoplanes sp. NPDC051346]|uniref:type VII secretion target n=1 Tax=Actinoplanes sp. NPDC051346 TaxID=3155048 RepID=UPI0034302BE9